jgi:hypothetical protein
MHVAAEGAEGAQRAELSYRVLAKEANGSGGAGERVPGGGAVRISSNEGAVSLLEVRPVTGRKHQIRVQLAAAGFPIVGDRKYGGRRPFSPGIALHSRRLVVTHPVSKMQIAIEAPTPKSWQRLLERKV